MIPDEAARSDHPDHPGHVDVVVIGGGITGLSAAFTILQLQPQARVVVLEASHQAGGKIASTRIAGTDVDCGPDAFLARVEGGVELATDLGLGDDLIAPGTGKAWLWSRGRLRALPEGLVLGVPTSITALARSGILSPKGLMRAAISEVVPTRPCAEPDPTVSTAIGRHLGREVVDLLVDPLLGGINASDCKHLSLASAAPNLVAATRKRHLMRALRQTQAAATRGTIGTETGASERPVFLTPRTGVSTIVGRLVERLGKNVMHGQSVSSIAKRPDGQWVVTANGRSWNAPQVIVATPAAAAAAVIEPLSRRAADHLKQIRTSSVALTLLAYPAGAVHLPPGSGMLVPRVEGRLLTASSWWNQKWPHLDTKGHVLLRASAGRDGDTRFHDLSDDELADRLHGELSSVLEISSPPVETHVARWNNGFPQYDSGHEARVDAIEAALHDDAPGLQLAGASYRGIGIPACIRSARAAALRAAAAIGSTHTGTTHTGTTHTDRRT